MHVLCVLCTRTVGYWLLAEGGKVGLALRPPVSLQISLFVVAQADLRPERRRHGHAWMRSRIVRLHRVRPDGNLRVAARPRAQYWAVGARCTGRTACGIGELEAWRILA